MDHSHPFLFQPIFKRQATYAFSFLLLLLSFLVCINVIAPFHPYSLLSISFLSDTLSKHRNSASQARDYSNGRWVHDESHSLRSYSEDCPFLDPGFKCHKNGRTDRDYLNWHWQPDGYDLPRFNASEMLERSRNRRIVFVGDSIGRNQWESLVCMLAQAVSNKSSIYEENGNPITKHKGYLSIRFDTYNVTVEYYRTPFLVIADRLPANSSHNIKSAVRVDKLHQRSQQWVGADVLIFNSGHWYTQDKTVKMGYYFQEGAVIDMAMDVKEAFRKSLQTWKQWAITNLDPERSHIFFRSHSPVHYRGGTWDGNGSCDSFKEPETNYSELKTESWNNQFISETIKEMRNSKRKVEFLNITYLTEFRKDGHPSIYWEPSKQVPLMQDCSHWCLPGVPDTWNELLYAHLLSNRYGTKNNTPVIKIT